MLSIYFQKSIRRFGNYMYITPYLIRRNKQILSTVESNEIENKLNIVKFNINETFERELNQIQNIDKFQNFYGTLELKIKIRNDASINSYFMNKKWCAIDNKIPEWSYPLVYKSAINQQKTGPDSHYDPITGEACENAEKTMKIIEEWARKNGINLP